MPGRHIILNRAITEDPMKRLPLIKHQKNNAGISGRGFRAGRPAHKDPKQKTTRYV